MTIWMSVQCTVFLNEKNLNYYHFGQYFLESTEMSASEESNALEKAPVQFMLLWKLSGKFHFLVWFCTNSWKRTYLFGNSVFANLWNYRQIGWFDWICKLKLLQKSSIRSPMSPHSGSATPKRFGAFTTCPAGNLCISQPSLRMLEKFKQHSDVPYVKYNGAELFLR